jgi:O-acetyl-ADP-ribose deacetylase
MPTKIQFLKGDVTGQAVDAIVCDTDTTLKLAEGLGAEVLRKGGARIREDCEQLAPVALGETAVTTAGSLRAFYIVYAVVRRPGEPATKDSLRLAMHHTLLRVEEKAFKSVAFSGLGIGAAGITAEDSAEVLIQEALNHLQSRSSMELLSFVLPDEATLQIFQAAYQRFAGSPS